MTANEPEKAEVLHVGIDLGTSRSSISTSAGERVFIDSYVGWPLDMVASRVLKKKILIGEDALKNRIMLDLHRPLERGLIKEGSDKDLTAVREIVAHLLKKAKVKSKHKVRAVIGVPAEAMRVNKQQLRNVLSGLVESLIIISEPFAVAYGLDALLHALIVDVGAGTSDFCVMNGRFPTDEDQRTLTQAGDWVDEQLEKLIADRHPDVTFSGHMAREWKEKNAFVGDPEGAVKVSVPVHGKPTEIDITKELKTACESLIAPITETMIELVAKVEPEYQAEVRNHIILSGGSALTRGLGETLERALDEYGGGSVRQVEDPLFVGSDGGLQIAKDAPASDWEKVPAKS
ncbi:MAG: rod shape-determining protein [Thermoanaerobaculia bacterium]